jgi:DNA-binding IclR family transcriptional regulator
MDSLALIRTFREVAHRGSFSDAAKALGTSKANASKYVAALEEVFGVRLLHRSTRNVSLTEPVLCSWSAASPSAFFAQLLRLLRTVFGISYQVAYLRTQTAAKNPSLPCT